MKTPTPASQSIKAVLKDSNTSSTTTTKSNLGPLKHALTVPSSRPITAKNEKSSVVKNEKTANTLKQDFPGGKMGQKIEKEMTKVPAPHSRARKDESVVKTVKKPTVADKGANKGANPKSKNTSTSSTDSVDPPSNSDDVGEDLPDTSTKVGSNTTVIRRVVSKRRPETPEENTPPPPLTRELRSIDIRLLVDTIKPIHEHPTTPYTPLILDRSQRVDMFFQYSADYSGVFIEGKKLVVDTLIRKTTTIEEALEGLRKTLVVALKYGRTLVIRLADSAPHFKTKFTHPDFFPLEVFEQGGRRFFDETIYERVIREEDKDKGVFVVRPEFKVVLTSMFELEDYEEFLKESVPMEYLIPVHIKPSENREGGEQNGGFDS